jgi:hypothetical protein
MSKFSRIVVLVTALASLSAVMSSTAGAVTWTNEGATTFHATSGSGTLSVDGNNLACSGSTATGDAPTGSFATSYSVKGTVTFSPCTIIGQAAHVACSYTLTAQTWTAGSPAITGGSADVTCTASLAATGTPLCHISGSTPGHYFNPTATAPGRVTLTASNTLQVTNESGSSCSAFGVPTGGTTTGSLTEFTETITSIASSPFITRS